MQVTDSLVLTAIKKSFSAEREVLDVLTGVNVRLDAPGLVRLIGENGSGKTTILNIISGCDSPDGGRIELNGRDISGVPEHRRVFCGRVFQDSALSTCYGLSVLETLCLAQIGARSSSLRRAITPERIERVEQELISVGLELLSKRLGERVGNLSGGERQLISILFLRMRTPRPRFILADEPTNHLDPANSDRVLRMLADTSEQCGVILVSHDKRAEKLPSRRLLLRNGAICEIGHDDQR